MRLCLVFVLLAALPAFAQPCSNAAADSLAAARRARSALIDEAAYRGTVDSWTRAMRLADAKHGVEDERVVQGQLVYRSNAIDGYDLCGFGQGHRPAKLIGGMAGFGLRAFDLEGDWQLDLSLLGGGDSLSPNDFRPSEGQQVSPDAVGRGYILWLVEAQVAGWVSVGYGGVTDAEAKFAEGTDGDTSYSNASFVSRGGPSRHFIRLGVPRWSLATTLLLDEDGALDFGDIGLTDVPVPGLERLRLGGALRHLEYEDLTVTEASAGYVLFDDRVRPTVSAAWDWTDSRARALRARLDLHLEGTMGKSLGGHGLPRVFGWAVAGVGAFAEVSRFGSALVDESHGGPAYGYRVGGALHAGFRAFEFELGGALGRNRVETLTRLPDAVDRTEQSLNVVVRVGW